jgi:2-polyprenyl-3-methyl-5-hydroxy-6-metoxy-1,4-benzoquinol methylase
LLGTGTDIYTMHCPYCKNPESTPGYLPSTRFNDKVFRYVQCSSCEVVYIDPLPDYDDYVRMYPVQYQNGVDKNILPDPYKKLPGLRFSYGTQFDLIRKEFPGQPKIIDYGCGNANFIVNAAAHSLPCDGVEFSEKHVQILKQELPASMFYTTEEFSKSPATYDVIRLSNVLEHMETPVETIRLLVSKLNKNGLLLVEGPIECNFNFAFFTRKLYFKYQNKLKGGYIANHTPTHITFTNYKNQKDFFMQFELTPLHFKVREAEWPYPDSILSAKGIGNKTKAIIAKISLMISAFIPKWGNTFIYIGRKQ